VHGSLIRSMGVPARVLLLLSSIWGSWASTRSEADCDLVPRQPRERPSIDDGEGALSLLQGQASSKHGRNAMSLAKERVQAKDAVMELSWKPHVKTAKTADSEESPVTRPKVFDLIQGLYGSIILLFLMSRFALHKHTEASGANRPTDRWKGLQAVLQLALFCEHSGRQPFAMEGVFFMLIGAAMCMEMQPSATIKDYIKTVSTCVVQILPTYWITLAIYFAIYTEDSFNPLEQLAMMPTLHKVDFYAATSVTSQYSSYWFVSTILGLCLYFPVVNMVLVQIRAHEKLWRGALLMVSCYLVQCLYAAYLLSTSHLPQYDKYSGFSIFARHFNGYPVSFCCNPITRLPEFMIGMLVGHTLRAISAEEERKRAICDVMRAKLAWAADLSAALLLAIIVVGVIYIIPVSSYHPNGLFRVVSRMNLLSPLWALLLLGTGCGDASGEWPSFVKSIFELQPLQFFGEVSYVFYLSHTFVLHTTNCFSGKNRPKCDPGALTTYYAYSLALAVVAYRIIEEPIRNVFKQALAPERAVKANEPVKQPFTS